MQLGAFLSPLLAKPSQPSLAAWFCFTTMMMNHGHLTRHQLSTTESTLRRCQEGFLSWAFSPITRPSSRQIQIARQVKLWYTALAPKGTPCTTTILHMTGTRLHSKSLSEFKPTWWKRNASKAVSQLHIQCQMQSPIWSSVWIWVWTSFTVWLKAARWQAIWSANCIARGQCWWNTCEDT